MSTKYGVLTSRPIIPGQIFIQTTCTQCHRPIEFPLPTPSPPQRTMLQIQCYSCSTVFTHAFYPSQIPSPSSSASTAGVSTPNNHNNNKSSTSAPLGRTKGRKIGTQDKPLETGYYDLLGIPVDASTDDIKKAYRRLAIKHHPDKNPDDPHAEERFKEIAIAYQTLFDPALRKKYNEFGSKETENENFVDPEAVFSSLFGGDRFAPLIGEISLARDMKSALQEAEEAEEEDAGKKITDAKGRPMVSEEERRRKEEKKKQKAEEKAIARDARIKGLVDNLIRKLGIFTESATGPGDQDVIQSWKTICELESEELKKESYGVELLQAIGFVYSAKARHFLATNQTFLGVGGWLHNVQGKYHVFSETVSTLRAAIELKSVFDQIQAAEQAGNLSPEEKRKLEEQAAEKGIQALFKGTKLEIESVLRESCDRVLEDPDISREKAEMRATALQIMGDAFMATRKETSELADESEYVRVETKQSRTRSSTAGAGPGPGTRR